MGTMLKQLLSNLLQAMVPTMLFGLPFAIYFYQMKP